MSLLETTQAQSQELRSSPTPSESTISAMAPVVTHTWRMTTVVSTNPTLRLPPSLSQVSYRSEAITRLHLSFTPGPFSTIRMARDVIAMSVSTKAAYLSTVTRSSKKLTLSSKAWGRLTGHRVPMSRRAVSLAEWRKQPAWRSCRPAQVICQENKTSSQRVKWRLTASSRGSNAEWAPIRQIWIRSFLNRSTPGLVSSTKSLRPASYNSIE